MEELVLVISIVLWVIIIGVVLMFCWAYSEFLKSKWYLWRRYRHYKRLAKYYEGPLESKLVLRDVAKHFELEYKEYKFGSKPPLE